MAEKQEAKKEEVKKEVVTQPIPSQPQQNAIVQLATAITNISNRLTQVEIQFQKLNASDDIINKRLNFYKELLEELKSKVEFKD